jgi:hypothetical protein
VLLLLFPLLSLSSRRLNFWFLSFLSIPYFLLGQTMCFAPPPKRCQKCPSKPLPKISLEGARIILGPDGARFSFAATSKLPSNFFIRQDFYGTDKPQAPPAGGTVSPQAYIPSPTEPRPTQGVYPHYDTNYAPLPLPAAPAPQPIDLVSEVEKATRLAQNLTDACTPRSRDRTRDRTRDRERDKDILALSIRERDRDRDILALSLERKNTDEIEKLKLERDIKREVASALQRQGQTASGGAASWYWGTRGAEWERERERGDGREMERDRERDRRERSAGSQAHTHFHMYQDVSHGRGFGDGFRERRRSSVVSVHTAARIAKGLYDRLSRNETEVDYIRQRERERERDRIISGGGRFGRGGHGFDF